MRGKNLANSKRTVKFAIRRNFSGWIVSNCSIKTNVRKYVKSPGELQIDRFGESTNNEHFFQERMWRSNDLQMLYRILDY
jgi:hypothetical protein